MYLIQSFTLDILCMWCLLSQETLRNEPPKERFKGSGMVRDGADKELDRLQKDVESIDLLIGSYEKQEQERTGIPSLKVYCQYKRSSFVGFLQLPVHERFKTWVILGSEV